MRKICFLISLLSIVVFILSGCAGNGGGSGGTNNPFAGAYDGSGTVESNPATLTMSVGNDGGVNGTLVIPQAHIADGNVLFPPGNYPFIGSADSSGNVTASGTSGANTFTLAGTLTNGGQGMSFTLSIDGNVYPITFEEHSSSGNSTFTFTNDQSNAHLGTEWTTGTTTFEIDGSDYRLNVLNNTPGFHRSFSINVHNTYHAGDVIDLNGSLSTIAYNETADGEFLPNAWRGTAGTMTVISVSATSMEVQLSNVTMTPAFNNATGTFILNGSAKN